MLQTPSIVGDLEFSHRGGLAIELDDPQPLRRRHVDVRVQVLADKLLGVEDGRLGIDEISRGDRHGAAATNVNVFPASLMSYSLTRLNAIKRAPYRNRSRDSALPLQLPAPEEHGQRQQERRDGRDEDGVHFVSVLDRADFLVHFVLDLLFLFPPVGGQRADFGVELLLFANPRLLEQHVLFQGTEVARFDLVDFLLHGLARGVFLFVEVLDEFLAILGGPLTIGAWPRRFSPRCDECGPACGFRRTGRRRPADPRTGGPADAERFFRTGDYAAFIQDNWKVRPNLTINLGLRYELFTPPTETEGRLTNFIIEPGTASGGRVVTVDKLFDTDKNNFAPRFGFAYSPSERLVLRGGFGISYNRIPNVMFTNTRGNPPYFARFAICCGTAVGDFSTPFAGGVIQFGVGSSNSPNSFPVNPRLAQGIDPVTGGVRGAAVEIYGAFPDTPNSHVYVYSGEGQYELPWQLVGSLGYQGSTGRRLIRLVDQTLLVPINTGNFFAVFFPQPDVNSNYNGLNARLTRRFTNNFSFETNYRFSKSKDHMSYEGPGAETNQTNPGNIDSEYGYSDFDVRHFLTFAGTYETNFFRSGNSAMRAIFDGFQINAIVTRNTGLPVHAEVLRGFTSTERTLLRSNSSIGLQRRRARRHFG